MVPAYPFVYATIDIATRISLCIHDYCHCDPHIYMICFNAAHGFFLYMSKMDFSLILGSLDGYAIESFGCNYFVFDANSS